MRLVIFDFDETITKLHTFLNSEEVGIGATDEAIIGNIKSQCLEAFRAVLASGDKLAIATFHNNPELVKRYLRLMGLTDEEIESIIIVTNGDANAASFTSGFKNGHINEVVTRCEAKYPDEIIDELVFYEDNYANYNNFLTAFQVQFPKHADMKIAAVLVPGEPEFNRHFSNVCDYYKTDEEKEGRRRLTMKCNFDDFDWDDGIEDDDNEKDEKDDNDAAATTSANDLDSKPATDSAKSLGGAAGALLDTPAFSLFGRRSSTGLNSAPGFSMPAPAFSFFGRHQPGSSPASAVATAATPAFSIFGGQPPGFSSSVCDDSKHISKAESNEGCDNSAEFDLNDGQDMSASLATGRSMLATAGFWGDRYDDDSDDDAPHDRTNDLARTLHVKADRKLASALAALDEELAESSGSDEDEDRKRSHDKISLASSASDTDGLCNEGDVRFRAKITASQCRTQHDRESSRIVLSGSLDSSRSSLVKSH